ncbi:hypothetical protein ABE28_017785 [Peribacillus muralis]|uniref:YtkA-like domain-containing protein n=1 Tax=Peribacillus muralis TaxID=264697 RepID=A0A1B3XSN1_9BACI|nr:hypothetical protein [Peribacillus muralis]AOH56218.1 hypothetical protein ABE28_017785 [Peribacillus muralis]
MKLQHAVIFLFLLVGLSIPNDADAEWSIEDDGFAYDPLNASKTFTITEKVKDVMLLHVLRGTERKFGYMDKPLLVDQEIVLEWLFWRNGEEIPLGELEVTATHADGISHSAKGVLINIKTPIKELPKAYTPQPVSFDSECIDVPVSMATTVLTFNETGIWTLQLYVHDQFMGDMNVSVTEKKEPIIDSIQFHHHPYMIK